ncbi:MAG TPA: SDR family NAD(P)-dependent oxidoreductase [Anaerovoracaceae bacterium]|nr:SDR family NAD(P)-dependent oxidoreductase [Anaerovoracaceae bacterium]
MFDLHGRVAVVTGASAGLGRQFALALAGQGADIAVLARREWKLKEVADEVRAKGVKCLVVPTDVTQSSQVKEAVKTVLHEYGKVDILVNNAGGGRPGPLTDYTDDDWRASLALDIDGVFYCTREFGREMVSAGYGRIVNIASILGKGGLGELPIIDYATAKGAVINFTRQAAAEWATKGVNVNAICPGFFASEANNPEAMKAMGGFIASHTPMGRPGVDGELDSTVIYLAADESSYVTGSICTCDGGWTCV